MRAACQVTLAAVRQLLLHTRLHVAWVLQIILHDTLHIVLFFKSSSHVMMDLVLLLLQRHCACRVAVDIVFLHARSDLAVVSTMHPTCHLASSISACNSICMPRYIQALLYKNICVGGLHLALSASCILHAMRHSTQFLR